MINKDFTYCTGYLCPMADECKRYDAEALPEIRSLDTSPKSEVWWMSAEYNPLVRNCLNFIPKT